MPVKLSKCLWLGNCEISSLIERLEKGEYRTRPNAREDANKLKKIIEDLYNLQVFLTKKSESPLIGPHVMLADCIEIGSLPLYPDRMAELLENIHDIIQHYRVSVNTYRVLGEAFEEIERGPKLETSMAIEYAKELTNRGQWDSYAPIAVSPQVDKLMGLREQFALQNP